MLGRHVIGYEIQKVLAAVDWFERRNRDGPVRLGVAGWGEGGLLALYSAAVDRRVDATLVSGYFAPRERLWQEPIYRNLFGVLNEFGDANLARLIVPRACVAEVVGFQPPSEMAGAPPWYLGTVPWNGRTIPLICFEGTCGQGIPPATGRSRIVVFHCLGSRVDGGYFGLVSHGFPPLVRVRSG